MKKSFIFFLLTMMVGFAKAQTVDIPDANFKAYLLANTVINKNGDDEIQVSEAIAHKSSINCSNKNISDLTGIAAFVNLTQLLCDKNQLTNLDLSKNTALEVLLCHDNKLTVLDVSKNTALYTLDCSNNQLTSLDVSKNIFLKYFDCNTNRLTSLDVKNATLQIITCNKNLLTSLNLTSTPKLGALYCSDNLLTQLDVTTNSKLEILSIDNNKLTDLNLSKTGNLFYALYCTNNQLKSLNLKNGYNSKIDRMYSYNNPNLACIQVDNPAASNNYDYWQKDATASYNTNCGYLSVSGIEKIQVKIFPNPAKDILNFSKEVSNIRITDLSGKIIEQNFNSVKSIDVSKLIKGTYIISATAKTGETINMKFIKE